MSFTSREKTVERWGENYYLCLKGEEKTLKNKGDDEKQTGTVDIQISSSWN